MYSLRQLLRGIQEPRRGFVEMKWLYNRELRGRSGVDVMARDWDNLIILDACRYDLFKEVNTIAGDLTTAISRGSSTSEFLQQNFSGKQFPDTVYVSANPKLESHSLAAQFYKSVPLWDGHWDEKLKTVLPQTVTSEAMTVEEEYPQKRLIVHSLQPHYPFIGETGQQIQHGSITGEGVISEDREVPSIWERLENGEIHSSTVWEAYRENLEIALPHITQLVENLTGKTVITSDHGNAFGEWGVFGHPSNCYLDSLVKIPWFVPPWTRRKNIERGDVSEFQGPSTDVSVSERLEHLGYMKQG